MLMIEADVRKKKAYFLRCFENKGIELFTLSCSFSCRWDHTATFWNKTGGFEKRTSEQRRLLQSMYAWQRLMINVC